MSTITPDALMLLGTNCPFCPAVLDGLTQLVKKGLIGKLEVINLEVQPETARHLGVRSVPWVRIGPFELEGQQTPAELAAWAERAASDEGIKEYLAELINTAGIHKAEQLIESTPAYFLYLLDLITDDETSLNIKIGIGALMEMLAESGIMHTYTDELGALTSHASPQVRIDACHYLSLTGDAATSTYIKPLLEDTDPQVVEVARESLDTLGS